MASLQLQAGLLGAWAVGLLIFAAANAPAIATALSTGGQ